MNTGNDQTARMAQRNLPRPILLVQGGQWGSEAKGAITAFLVSDRNVDFAVRTGAVNAGHTMYFRGVEYKMQQIPCAFHNPRTILVLGAGAMIHPEILARELEFIYLTTGEDIRHRLLIDYRAGLHLPIHQKFAAEADRHHKMGATGKGCSEAVTAKIRERGNKDVLQFKRWLQEWGDVPTCTTEATRDFLNGLNFIDTERLLNDAYDSGKLILLEATQGTLLDLHLGPYPYTTHKQSIAGQWPTECGLSPALQYEIVSVCRTYPIRVAGNSGPMPGEISWVTLARRINRKLMARGLQPMVSEAALQEFELACVDIANTKYKLQDTNFHNWDQAKREKYRVVISELHKDALNAIGGASFNELRRLFEMTTVTKKLRRIADWDGPTMQASMRQNRPSYVCLTFLNYEFPQYWNETKPEVVMADPQVLEYIAALEQAWGCRINYVTTGPRTEHVLPVRYGILRAAAANHSNNALIGGLGAPDDNSPIPGPR